MASMVNGFRGPEPPRPGLPLLRTSTVQTIQGRRGPEPPRSRTFTGPWLPRPPLLRASVVSIAQSFHGPHSPRPPSPELPWSRISMAQLFHGPGFPLLRASTDQTIQGLHGPEFPHAQAVDIVRIPMDQTHMQTTLRTQQCNFPRTYLENPHNPNAVNKRKKRNQSKFRLNIKMAPQ